MNAQNVEIAVDKALERLSRIDDSFFADSNFKRRGMNWFKELANSIDSGKAAFMSLYSYLAAHRPDDFDFLAGMIFEELGITDGGELESMLG